MGKVHARGVQEGVCKRVGGMRTSLGVGQQGLQFSTRWSFAARRARVRPRSFPRGILA
jgi:hypothetical protein